MQEKLSISLWILLLSLLLLPFCFDAKAECTAETIGLCTPGTTTETSGSEIIETTVEHKDSGDLLNGFNEYVTVTLEGDMDSDWGGRGTASIRSGSYCNELGTDKCAEITSSTLTTFYQEIYISSLDITNGGRTNYTIKVDKQDSQDRIYMKIHASNGNGQIFKGTDILSETGVTSGYQQYSGGFDFGGAINKLTIEVGGRDINLAVGPLFDDVTINVLYNVVSTIVTQQIQDLEEFLVLDYGQDANDVAEMIFENNEVTDDFNFEPIEKPMDEFSFETVETEMELDLSDIESIEVEEVKAETENIEEVKPEQATEETKQTKDEPKKIVNQKQNAANTIVKDMGDKGRYEADNQLKTLIVMQVLGDTKTFFDSQKMLQDTEGFFTNDALPDTILSDNNIAQYLLFGGSNSLMDQLVDSQYN